MRAGAQIYENSPVSRIERGAPNSFMLLAATPSRRGS